jgi:flagellin-like protein
MIIENHILVVKSLGLGFLLNMIFERKGLSNVVAVVLLLLLTVAAVSIVASFIIPFVNKSLEDTNCFNFRDHFTFDETFSYNCYEEFDDAGIIKYNYLVSVGVGSEDSLGDVNGFNLRFFGDGIAKGIDVIDGENEGEIKMEGIPGGKLIIPTEMEGGYPVLSYRYDGVIQEYEKIEIIPILKGDKVCDVSDSINLIRCS